VNTINKNKAATSALLLIFVLGFSSIAFFIPTASALTQVTCYLSVSPEVIGVSQTLLVNFWIYPIAADQSGHMYNYQGVNLIFTAPDGSNVTQGPLTLSLGSNGYSTFVPTKVGNWQVAMTFSGDQFAAASHSPAVPFTVQQQPVQIGVAPVPLPTGYWDRPISPNNRDWAAISGPWLQSGWLSSYDAHNEAFNAYTTAPNTSHIVWSRQVNTLAGLAGGPQNDFGTATFSVTPPTGGVVIGGISYQSYNGEIHAFSLRTGEEIWAVPGYASIGQIYYLSSFGTQLLTGSLWDISGPNWTRYDANTGVGSVVYTNVPIFGGGAVLPGNVAAFPGSTSISGLPGSYNVWYQDPNNPNNILDYMVIQSGWNTTRPNHLAINRLVKWDMSKVVGTNWPTGIVWNVTLPDDIPGDTGEVGVLSGIEVVNDSIVLGGPGVNKLIALNNTDGSILWSIDKGFHGISMRSVYSELGLFLQQDLATRIFHAYNVFTGQEVWQSEPLNYPWGSISPIGSGQAYAYNHVYLGDYSGRLYCLDGFTGKTLWTYFVGNSTETPYDSNPLSIGCIADGKVYCYVSDVYQPDPRYRGYTTFAVNAYTGQPLWSVNNTIQVDICADGYLVGGSWYDGAQYCFGKGQTATTVQSTTTTANTVSISGTVMDMSPAQPNTPCVSNTSMDAWMNYLHFQTAKPSNVQGVPVQLTATNANGSTITIGTVNSDGFGVFAYQWTPPSASVYKIQATFAGTDAYFSSTGGSAVTITGSPGTAPSGSVSPTGTASASVAPAPGTNPTTMTIYIGIAVAVIIIVAVAAAIILRRR
jgi:hypothetical protein